MSWRLFGQIVLLILISAFILGAVKCHYGYRYGKKWAQACPLTQKSQLCAQCIGKLCPSCAAKAQ